MATNDEGDLEGRQCTQCSIRIADQSTQRFCEAFAPLGVLRSRRGVVVNPDGDIEWFDALVPVMEVCIDFELDPVGPVDGAGCGVVEQLA